MVSRKVLKITGPEVLDVWDYFPTGPVIFTTSLNTTFYLYTTKQWAPISPSHVFFFFFFFFFYVTDLFFFCIPLGQTTENNLLLFTKWCFHSVRTSETAKQNKTTNNKQKQKQSKSHKNTKQTNKNKNKKQKQTNIQTKNATKRDFHVPGSTYRLKIRCEGGNTVFKWVIFFLQIGIKSTQYCVALPPVCKILPGH